MNKLKNCKGITMIALVVTIVILIILASISIIEGKKLIKEAKIENILTDMITIKAKVKGYAEELEKFEKDSAKQIVRKKMQNTEIEKIKRYLKGKGYSYSSISEAIDNE